MGIYVIYMPSGLLGGIMHLRAECRVSDLKGNFSAMSIFSHLHRCGDRIAWRRSQLLF